MQSSLVSFSYPTFSGITLGKVYTIKPEANMVDLLMFDGSILENVQVMVPFSSSKCGAVGLPDPKYKKDMLKREDPLGEALPPEESDVVAVVAHLGGSIIRPIVIGFLFPEINEVLCNRAQAGNEDGTMFLWKHPSNVYFRVAKGKDLEEGKTPELEISHPSGLFIRIGVPLDDGGSPAIPILRGITNYDSSTRSFQKLNPESGEADPIPTVRLYHPSGTTIFIDAEGSVTINVKKDVTTTIEGNVTETITGNVDRTINGNLTEVVKGDYDGEVQGDKTEKVNLSWKQEAGTTLEREAGTSIDDSAPSVTHN